MIFVSDGIKYDTSKMSRIPNRLSLEERVRLNDSGVVPFKAKKVELYKGKYDRWLLTYNYYGFDRCEMLDELSAKEFLLIYNMEVYEKLFGELEEA